MRKLWLACLLGAGTIFAAQPSISAGIAHPELWPALKNPVPLNRKIEARIAVLLASMSLEQKVGQIIQADLGSVTPDDVKTYHLGSVLNGGNSAPGGKQFAAAPEWLADADRFYDASVTPDGRLPIIPITWGSDAVHGHNNVVGATLFPHNIGLGAMRDPALMRRIGEVTATEMRITGLDWTFAPTLAVVRDDRWGRTYESYAENPAVVASYAGPLVEGLQGKVGSKSWLKGGHIVATAKHFVGDGGTTGGKDQGDNASSETELRDVQAAGYRGALEAGIQSVMASYSSWQGVKMHGNASLLTEVLRGRMQFDGFVVGDWNGHGQIPGCTPTDCPAALMAGLDMYMAPDSWKALYASTLAQAKSGAIPITRLDEAVSRILRVKFRAGLFEAGRPSSRPLAGQFGGIGSPEHRAVARQAVRESLVLLKNEGAVLPLKPGTKILVAGDGANSFMKQSGGWTLNWQGTGLKRDDFPGATTIGQAIVNASGGKAQISVDGSYAQRPDVAVVVFGEDPYAEFQGDVPDLLFRDKADTLALLKRYQAAGIKTVSVFLSGRPLWVNPQINASDAFVAAWLPGSEGGGVADVLFGKADFRGKLSFSWPKRADQFRLNLGDMGYDPLFAYGYGLRYASPRHVVSLSEENGLAAQGNMSQWTWFAHGRYANGLTLAWTGNVKITPTDRDAQEDAVRLAWLGGPSGSFALASTKIMDLSRESNGALAIEMNMRVDRLDANPLLLRMGCGANCGAQIDISRALRSVIGKGWQTLSVPLSCFAKAGVDMTRIDAPLMLLTAAATDITVSRLGLGSSGIGKIACGN
jgi:beta-glucosidase